MTRARAVPGGKQTATNAFRALLWTGEGEQVVTDLVLVPASFTVGGEERDVGVGIALAGNPDHPIFVVRGDSARVLLHELMRHVRIEESA